MRIVGIILFFVTIIGTYLLLKYKKDGKLATLNKKELLGFVVCLGLLTLVGAIVHVFGVSQENKDVSLDALHSVLAIIIALIIVFDIYFVLFASYYRKSVLIHENDTEKKRKLLRTLTIIGAYLLIPLVALYLECLCPALIYPFSKNIISFSNGRGLSFYAVFIICGAATTYFVSDHYVAKAGYGHGNLENCLYIAFPMGIVGARIWYVIAEWNDKFAGQSFGKVFAIWEGGLAVQGGVLLGAVVGIAYMMIKHKDIPILFLVDTIIPGILLAQAIGRWGNFMNHEVYGTEVSTGVFPWTLLPTWIKGQMYVNLGDASKMYVPLFLIEGILNIAGYFLIAYGIRRGLKKVIVPGDQAFAYLLVYGTIRVCLEPLRNKEFIMGATEGVQKSSIMSIAFIVIGALGIITLHIIDIIRKKKNKNIAEKSA